MSLLPVWKMILSLQNFQHLLIYLLSLFLVILEIFPKYGNTILSSNFGTVVKTGFWTNILLTNFKCYEATKISVYTTEGIFSENTCRKFIFFSTNLNMEKRKGIIFLRFKRKINIFVSFVHLIYKS